MTVETPLQHEEALPQLMGDFHPVDVWQGRMNRIFYGLRGHVVRDYYQTFAAADFRLAYATAEDYVAQVKTRQKITDQRPHSSSSPLCIMEWGCGNGNFAACFLDRLKELDENQTMYPRVHYMLIDSEDVILESAKRNADLEKHQGRYVLQKADVMNLGDFVDGSVDFIVCNELWNELPTKLVLRKGHELQEEHIRPNLKESRLNDISDWSTFVNAFDQIDCQALKIHPSFLEDIVWEREYQKVEGKDLPFRRVVTDFLKRIEEEVLVPVNIGAAMTLKEAKRLLAHDAIGFRSFDAGTIDAQVLNDPEKPCYGLHGGQFSFMVNFSLLEEVAGHLGGKPFVEPQKEFVGRSLGTNVMTVMDLLASHASLPKGNQWELDRLIVKTLETLNRQYQSPYNRRIEFPVSPDTPKEERENIERILQSLSPKGVPDTIAYLTEEEIFAAMGELEDLGYDREGIKMMLMAPPPSVDYYLFSFNPARG